MCQWQDLSGLCSLDDPPRLLTQRGEDLNVSIVFDHLVLQRPARALAELGHDCVALPKELNIEFDMLAWLEQISGHSRGHDGWSENSPQAK